MTMLKTTYNVSEDDLVQDYNNRFRDTVFAVTVFFGVEMVFGFCGNLLTIYVFLFQYKRCNFRYFVLGLALTDFISCVTTIPGEIVSQIFWFAYPFPALCKAKVFFNQFTVCSESALLTLIGVDRYRKICQPLGWQVSQRAALGLCIGAFITSAVFSAPTPIFWGVHKDKIIYKGRNISLTLCEKDELYQYTLLPLTNTIANGCLAGIAMICMLVLYILVVRQILKSSIVRPKPELRTNDAACVSSRKMQSGNLSQSPDPYANPAFKTDYAVTELRNIVVEESRGKVIHTMERTRRKTMIGFYMALIFIITTIMYFALISTVATGILKSLNGPNTAVFFFFLRLYFINHVINPILYGILDPEFRKEMARLKSEIIKVFSLCSRNSGE